MGYVGSLRIQYHFGVAGNLDSSRLRAVVRDLELANFGIVFGRDGDFQMCLQVAIAAVIFGLVDRKHDFISLGRRAGWLVGRAPDALAADIAKINELP